MAEPYHKDLYAIFKDPLSALQWGMDRHKLSFSYTDLSEGIVVNLGAGMKLIQGSEPLDAERGWLAGETMPYGEGTVAAFIVFHFWEHLAKHEIMDTLRECERTLQIGGKIISVTPHYSSQIAHQDLDHKSFWTIETWNNLFNNQYYYGTMPRDWRLREVETATFLAGYNERNMVIVSQLERY